MRVLKFHLNYYDFSQNITATMRAGYNYKIYYKVKMLPWHQKQKKLPDHAVGAII